MANKTTAELIRIIKELADTISDLLIDNQEKENMINVLMSESNSD